MRKINGKLFLGLLIGTGLLVGMVFAVHHFQYRRIAGALLRQAQRAEEQSQPKRAVKYLQRYLEFNPQDLTEKTKLARTWASEPFAGNYRARDSAVRLLDEVLTYQDDPELRRLLVKVALELGGIDNLKKAREHLARLLPLDQVKQLADREKALRAAAGSVTRLAGPAEWPAELTREDPARGELEGYWGQLFETESQKELAVACYRLACRHAPQFDPRTDTALVPTAARLANLLRRLSEPDAETRAANHAEAAQLLDDLVARNSASHLAYLTRWRFRRDFDLLAIRETANKGQVNLDEAARDVAQAVKREPEGVDVLLAAADLERLRGRQAAEDVKRTPAERQTALRNHRGRAQEYLQRGLDLVARKGDAAQTDLPRFQLLWHKANLLLDDLDRNDTGLSQRDRGDAPAPASEEVATLKAEIREAIEQVRKTRVSAAAEYLQGRLLVHERRWGEAATLFEAAQKLLAPQPDLAAQANLYLGQCYERLEEHKLMYDAFRRVADWDATSVPAQMGMAMALWAQGKLGDAADQYRLVMSQNKVPSRGWTDIARLEMQKQAQADKPDWKESERLVALAGKEVGTVSNEVALLQAELALRQRRPLAAEKALRDALEVKPKDAELYAALADLAVQRQDGAAAQQVIDEGKAKAGDSVLLRTAQARQLALTRGKDAAADIQKLAEGAEKFDDAAGNSDDRARLLSGLADALTRIGAEGPARQAWQQVAALPRQRGDLRLRLLLFDLAVKANDRPGVDRALEDIKEVEQGSGTFHRYGQALRILWLLRSGDTEIDRTRSLAEARNHLDQVLAARPSWPPVFLARAEIAEMNGNPDGAIRDLQMAVNNGEGSTAVVRRLAGLLVQRDRGPEADVLLKQHQKALRASPELNRLAVGVALKASDYKRALAMARSVVPEESKAPADLVWLGRVLAEAKKFPEAEVKFDEAIKQGGADPVPWVAKVQFLAAQKERRAEALKLVAEAEKALAKAPDAPLALARCHEALGQNDEATRMYERALKAKADDAAVVRTVANFYLGMGRLKDAEPLLRSLVTGAVKSKPDDASWARRGLAVALATGTDYRRFAEAMDLVGLKLDAEGRLASVAATGDEKAADDRRAQARVLASQSQRQFRARAIELLEGLARDRALTAEDQYVLALLYTAEGQAQKAQARLGELIKAPTRTPQYLAQYALSLLTLKRQPSDLEEAGRVIGWIEELERQREVGPNAYASVELRARLLEARGEGDQAVTLLKKHAARPGAMPDEVLLVLASLGRQRRSAEAFDLCEAAWKGGKVSPEALGAVAVAVLNGMDAKDAQLASVEKHLKAALEAKPDSTVLLMHLSGLYDRRRDYAAAEKCYRDVLTREPNNVIALNNLAWLMATRDGDAKQALEFINQAVAGLGRRADLLDTRGQVYMAMNDTDRALADLKEAVADGPSPARLFHLAQAHHLAKDGTNARKVLREAKDKGLEVARLHPIEQDAARKLLDAYGLR